MLAVLSLLSSPALVFAPCPCLACAPDSHVSEATAIAWGRRLLMLTMGKQALGWTGQQSGAGAGLAHPSDASGAPWHEPDRLCYADSAVPGAGRPLKLFLVELALGWAGQKGGAALDRHYKLPRMRYKGAAPQPQAVRLERRPLVTELAQAPPGEPSFPLLAQRRSAPCPAARAVKNVPLGDGEVPGAGAWTAAGGTAAESGERPNGGTSTGLGSADWETGQQCTRSGGAPGVGPGGAGAPARASGGAAAGERAGDSAGATSLAQSPARRLGKGESAGLMLPAAAAAAAPPRGPTGRPGEGSAAGDRHAAPAAGPAATPAAAPGQALAPPPSHALTLEGRPLVAARITVQIAPGAIALQPGAYAVEVCGERVRVGVPGCAPLEVVLPLGVRACEGGAAAELDAGAGELRLRLPFSPYAECLEQVSSWLTLLSDRFMSSPQLWCAEQVFVLRLT